MRRAAALLAACLAAGAAAAQTTASMAGWLAATYGPEILSSSWFEGPAGTDGAAPGVSVAYFPIPGGNAFQIGADAFAVTAAGATHRGSIDGLFGTEPRDAAFGAGVMTLTTTMPRPGDPRCCPTGATRWTIDLNALKVVAETPLP
jgi:hypothetical protein